MNTEIALQGNNQAMTAVSPQRMEELLKMFIAAQDVKQSSKGLYERTLRLYFSWVRSKGYLLSEMALPHLLQYKEELLGSGRSALTVSSYITSVRRFYEWTEANKYYANIGKGVKSPKRRQQFKKSPLTPLQAQALLSHCKENALREHAIVSLLLRTGLRTIEVVRADVEDITLKGDQRVLLVKGKGRDEKDSFVLLTENAFQPIAQYLAHRGNAKAGEPLFTSESNNNVGGRLTTRTISQMAKDGLRAIGLNERAFTAHSLRHTAGVSILRAGGSLEDAQLMLRHSSPATTQIYTATLDEERRLKHSGEALIDSLY